ncbi:MAG: HlyD family efflux transporter periplasmic adaptor subunit [Candidatus Omnitrophica bacterium]|nr:HlyD family efflux transporter periplasmic adaptor subunit [Candidatus Omnitrophota bacterium]MBU4488497.1 HlyD family efflux transporter periplasmic adaptor subunit [Candidatus Omnitrophota bacterium]MCG2704591.1 HlyD family efflux transporter periplasmic adaptor subunit [Candidatus Omnitrophota bacterium]
MRNKKIIYVVLIAVTIAAFFYFKMRPVESENGMVVIEIKPSVGAIENIISTTGTVLPKNRLEIKPPVNGRVDKILVKEGERVETGQTLGWMSSTERAALLDAARGQGEEVLKYWEGVYKPIPLISPIDGEVIVATTQPGQTVTTSDAVIVLSDHLIARAQVDETDIGKIAVGQNATIVIDAYPDTRIKAKVEHIYYESQTVNNVTIYNADLLPEKVLPFFRSGMNATIDFIESSKEDALLLPSEAVVSDKEGPYVFVKQSAIDKEGRRQLVTLGISSDKKVEITSGITANDTILVKGKKYALPKSNTGTNPFMPQRRR